MLQRTRILFIRIGLVSVLCAPSLFAFAQMPTPSDQPLVSSTPLPYIAPTPPPLNLSNPQLPTGFTPPRIFNPATLVPPVAIATSPSTPSPGESFTAKATTPTFDKDTAEFFWAVNGVSKPDLSGLGKDTIQSTAGEVGSATGLSVRIRKPSGEIITAVHTVLVADLTLTWTSDSYIPPWYKGKALPVFGSYVRIAAIPNFVISGVRIPASRLIFTWSIDGVPLASGPGLQTQTVSTPTVPNISPLVKVVVEDIDRRLHKESRLPISVRNSEVVLYPVFPLGGIETRKNASYFALPKTDTVDFQAEPFFYPYPSRSKLTYHWSIDRTDVEGLVQNPFLISVDTSRKPQKDVRVSVRVESGNFFIPDVLASLLIPFIP